MGLRRAGALRRARRAPLILAATAAFARALARAVASLLGVVLLGFLLVDALGTSHGDVRDRTPGAAESAPNDAGFDARPAFFEPRPEDARAWTRRRIAEVEAAAERAGREVLAAAKAPGVEALTADSVVHLLIERALDGRLHRAEALVGVAPEMREAVGRARREILAVADAARRLVLRGAATTRDLGPAPNPITAPFAATARRAIEARAAERPAFRDADVASLRAAVSARDAAEVARLSARLHETSDAPTFGAYAAGTAPDAAAKDAALVPRAARFLRREGDRFRTFEGPLDRAFAMVRQTRFGAFVGDLLSADFGESTAVRPGVPVLSLLSERWRRTALLVGPSLALLFLLGAPLGLRAARKPGGPFDRALLVFLGILHAAPEFWIGTLVVVHLGATGVGWIPAAGLLSPESEAALLSGASPFRFSIALDYLKHVVAPVFVLSAPAWLVVVRHARAAAADAAATPWFDAARLRGAAPSDLGAKLRRHAAAPVAALFGASLPALIGGSVVVETLFDVPGAARLAADAALLRDGPVATALLLFGGALSVFGRVVADLFQAILDPRVSERGA